MLPLLRKPDKTMMFFALNLITLKKIVLVLIYQTD